MSSSSRSPSASGGAGMKQGKLSFPAAKRTASASGAKRPGNIAKSKSALNSSNHDRSVEVVEQDSKTQVGKDEIKKKVSPSTSQKPRIQQDIHNEKNLTPELRPKLNTKDARWRQLIADAKVKRGGLPLIHGKNENEIHQVLRAFDLNYDYGPCVGVTRLDRWERADALGLNPPAEIRDILITHEGSEDKSYIECVFHDEV